MTQAFALFLDAYRDLNSRKLFWIVLILSTIVAASFGALGLTSNGVEVFAWKIPSEYLNNQWITPADFYNFIFDFYGIGFWLTWVATILALVSTGGLFPDFLAAGAVDLYLSKPIGRLRLFATKYVFGLLFVAVQIVCFCTACFLVIGIRGSVWEPGLFMAVPLVVLFFSYIFCVCVLLGVWTRSTIAAVMLTLLFWVGVWGVHKAEVSFLAFKIISENHAARVDRQISATQEMLAHAQQSAATQPTTRATRSAELLEADLQEEQTERAGISTAFGTVHEFLYAAMLVLPKTNDTIDMLDRKLIDFAHLQRVAHAQDQNSDNNPDSFGGNREDSKAFNAELRKRTGTWAIGTSLIFEAVVLGLAAWIFCRRDY
jgi:ABC-type transport system involved in multi-copper enzyme maturation permease subunit